MPNFDKNHMERITASIFDIMNKRGNVSNLDIIKLYIIAINLCKNLQKQFDTKQFDKKKIDKDLFDKIRKLVKENNIGGIKQLLKIKGGRTKGGRTKTAIKKRRGVKNKSLKKYRGGEVGVCDICDEKKKIISVSHS